MKILTRGKGIGAYSNVEGSLRIDFNEENEKVILKCNVKDSQYIVEINKYEAGDVLMFLLFDHDEAVRKLLRWKSMQEINRRLNEILRDVKEE